MIITIIIYITELIIIISMIIIAISTLARSPHAYIYSLTRTHSS